MHQLYPFLQQKALQVGDKLTSNKLNLCDKNKKRDTPITCTKFNWLAKLLTCHLYSERLTCYAKEKSCQATRYKNPQKFQYLQHTLIEQQHKLQKTKNSARNKRTKSSNEILCNRQMLIQRLSHQSQTDCSCTSTFINFKTLNVEKV